MILLDSDHLSILTESRHKLRALLWQRLDEVQSELRLPIIVVEEQLRGWLAAIRRYPDVHKQIVPYLRLAKFTDYMRYWEITAWNEPAADVYKRLRTQRIRIGTQDLKIASIALANQALLLSANLRDFEQVPGLQVENWLRA